MTASISGAMGQLAAGANVTTSNPTDVDPPTNVDTYTYSGGTKWGVQWVNAGAYYTQIDKDGDGTYDYEVAPGVTSKDIGALPIDVDCKVRHRSGGYYSIWVGIA